MHQFRSQLAASAAAPPNRCGFSGEHTRPRVLVSAPPRKTLVPNAGRRRVFNGEGAIASTRGACAPQSTRAGPAGERPETWWRLVGGFKAALFSLFVSEKKCVILSAKVDKEDLKSLGDFMETGKVIPVIDRTYTLRETAEAMRHLETGHARGKVIIAVEQDNKL